RLGRDSMVLHCKSQIGPAHRAALLLQLREGVVRMQLMQHMPVDIDQIAAVGALRNAMKLPDLFEQSSLHESSVYDCLGQIGLHILVGGTFLSKRRNRWEDNSCLASS